jgi:hypothetical protein
VYETKNDFIYNWRNELKSHSSGQGMLIQRLASDLKQQGYNRSDAIEILASENFDLDMVEKYASSIFQENVKEAQKATYIPVVPTKYDDCKPAVENTLKNVSAKEFAKRLCQGDHAIVKVSNKAFDSLVKLAEYAQKDSNALQTLHSELKPWFEECLLSNVLTAQNSTAKIANTGNNTFRVAIKNHEAEVDLNLGKSNSNKYTQGNYESFGLADEFLVYAADSTSPYERLKKALNI